MIVHRGHRFPFSYRFPVFSFPRRSACFPWGGPVLKDGPPGGQRKHGCRQPRVLTPERETLAVLISPDSKMPRQPLTRPPGRYST
jgi:hypothetical protein